MAPPRLSPRFTSHPRIGDASTSLMYRSKRAWNTLAELFAYAAWAIDIAIRPGTMYWSYGKPSISRMRSPSERPNTRMNSALDRIGAATVWVHSLSTRAVSREESARRPRWVASQVVIGD
jgi:hypothetical protein